MNNQWFDVNKSLPPLTTWEVSKGYTWRPILVVTKTGEIQVANYYDGEFLVVTCHVEDVLSNVTHWMKLPEPPMINEKD